jgi:hypothetical protein
MAARGGEREVEVYDGRTRLGRITGRAGCLSSMAAEGRNIGTFSSYSDAQAAIFHARQSGVRAAAGEGGGGEPQLG